MHALSVPRPSREANSLIDRARETIADLCEASSYTASNFLDDDAKEYVVLFGFAPLIVVAKNALLWLACRCCPATQAESNSGKVQPLSGMHGWVGYPHACPWSFLRDAALDTCHREMLSAS
jgi:hypothetical protein